MTCRACGSVKFPFFMIESKSSPPDASSVTIKMASWPSKTYKNEPKQETARDNPCHKGGGVVVLVLEKIQAHLTKITAGRVGERGISYCTPDRRLQTFELSSNGAMPVICEPASKPGFKGGLNKLSFSRPTHSHALHPRRTQYGTKTKAESVACQLS
jgi:hypothetical protein